MLYGIRFPTNGNVSVYRLDPATGATALVASSGSPDYFFTQTSLDPISRRYFFNGASPNGLVRYIYGVNIDTGVVTTAPAPSSLNDWKWDPVTAKLIGDFPVSPGGNLGVYSMDPDTGVRTLLVATAISDYNFPGRAAFDPVRRRFFVVTATRLYTIDLITGTVTNVHPSRQFVNPEGDPISGQLYSDYFGEVDSMDPLTGAAVTVAITGALGAATERAFDPVGRRYFFVNDQTYTVDVTTGAFTHVNVSGTFEELEYDVGAPAPPQPAPLFSNLTLALLAAGLAFLGVVATLRR